MEPKQKDPRPRKPHISMFSFIFHCTQVISARSRQLFGAHDQTIKMHAEPNEDVFITGKNRIKGSLVLNKCVHIGAISLFCYSLNRCKVNALFF